MPRPLAEGVARVGSGFRPTTLIAAGPHHVSARAGHECIVEPCNRQTQETVDQPRPIASARAPSRPLSRVPASSCKVASS